MSRFFQSLLICAGAFVLGWFGNGWSPPARAQERTGNPAAPLAPATTADRMEQFLLTQDASARIRLLAAWQNLTLPEIKKLWEERDRVPKVWRHAVRRQLLLAWLALDSADACVTLIPGAAARRMEHTMATRFIETGVDIEERQLPALVTELAFEWLEKNPGRRGELVPVLWGYTQHEDGGWDSMSAAEAFAKLMPERFLQAMEAHSIREECLNTAIAQIALTDSRKALQLAEYYDLPPHPVLEKMAIRDPQAAIRLARLHEGEPVWRYAEWKVLQRWMDADPARAVQYVRSGLEAGTLPVDARDDGINWVADALLKNDPAAAWKWLAALTQENAARVSAQCRVIAAMAAKHPDHAAELLAGLENDGRHDRDFATAQRAVVEARLKTETPEAVHQWCLQQPEVIRAALLKQFFSECVSVAPQYVLQHATDGYSVSRVLSTMWRHPDAALSAWQSLPAAQQQNSATELSEIMMRAGRMDQAMELAAVAIAQNASFKPDWLSRLSNPSFSGEEKPPSGAPLMDWLGTLPPDKVRPAWVEGGFRRWLTSNSEQALAWQAAHAGSQPAPIRQKVNSLAVEYLADSDPEKAAAWAATGIPDQTERHAALKAAFTPIWKSDPALAAAALTKAGLTPAEQQAMFAQPAAP